MKHLKKILEKLTVAISEGGNAVSNVSRIMLEEVQPTLKEIEKQILNPLGLNLTDVGVLGSTGKKESSGDIDLAIKIDMDIEDFYNKVSSLVDYEVVFLKGVSIISVGFPIYDKDGNKTDRLVQVDLMKIGNVDYSRFSYYSPYSSDYKGELGEHDVTSKYKGLFRNEILFTVASLVNTEILEEFDGEPVLIKRLQFDLNKGLQELVKTRKGKKGIVKTFKTETSKVLTDNPRDIIDLLFGKEFSQSDINSWERGIKTIESNEFIHRDKIQLIIKQLFKNVKTKVVRLYEADEVNNVLSELGNSFTKYKDLWDMEIEK